MDKLKIARKRIADLENAITEYRQRESGHIVAGNYGNGISEEEVQDV